MIFVLFYSLICPLYHHANNSISTIGYLFMCDVTYYQMCAHVLFRFDWSGSSVCECFN